MMTKKHYEMIAAALKNAQPAFPAEHVEAARMHSLCAREIADKLAADRPEFDRDRFLKAAGADDEVRVKPANDEEEKNYIFVDIESPDYVTVYDHLGEVNLMQFATSERLIDAYSRGYKIVSNPRKSARIYGAKLAKELGCDWGDNE